MSIDLDLDHLAENNTAITREIEFDLRSSGCQYNSHTIQQAT